MFDDDDTLDDEGIESGTGASGDLPDDGIEGKGEGTGSEGVAEGEAGPASGTTEGDDAVGIV